MKIEEIREKLGPDYRVEEKDGVITVCDIWDGVEFARCVRERNGQFSEGGVYRIQKTERGGLYLLRNNKSDFNGLEKEYFTPASEDEYVEQLKIEADIRFGEIRDGDRFDRGDMEFEIQLGKISVSRADLGWDYYKDQDQLFFGDLCLYNKGKWAEKLKSRVSVEVEDWKTTTNAEFKSFDFRVEMRVESSHPFDPNESAVYLAKCLKEYLNKS